ncbi:MAG: ROK family protein [Cellvibrionaceae bacterium]
MNIGIDLGGTKTEIICLDNERRERYRQRVTSPQNNYHSTVDTIRSLVEQTERTLNITATVGIGIPGSINRSVGNRNSSNRSSETVKNSNSTWINGQPFKKDLQEALGREIKIENDANCFALSESIDGAATTYSTVFGVIIGTGCGGGLVVDGSLVSGPNGIAGEWGHNPLPFPRILNNKQSLNNEFFDRYGKAEVSSIYQKKQSVNYSAETMDENEYPGPLCYCGKRGCLETWISGSGFALDFQRLSGELISSEEIIQLVEMGDVLAGKCLGRYCERLAKSLSQVINIIDPDVIVLGGGMSNINALYDEVISRWDKYIFSDTDLMTPLVKAHHGDSSGVRGAALLWPQK